MSLSTIIPPVFMFCFFTDNRLLSVSPMRVRYRHTLYFVIAGLMRKLLFSQFFMRSQGVGITWANPQ